MIKKILFLISSLLLFFPVSKVFALPSGEGLSEFATRKRELAQFYVNNGRYWISLYGNEGTGTSCGSSSSPEPNAPLSCWNNRILSYSTYSLDYADYLLTSYRIYTTVPIVPGNYYDVTITYKLSSTQFQHVANWWKLTDYEVAKFTSTCEGVNCVLDFRIKSNGSNTLDDMWINLNTSNFTFTYFNQAVAYWYAPYVRQVADSGGSVDIGPLVDQNQIIIDQNNQTNNKLEDINDSINSDNVDDFSDTINSFEGFLEENSTITQLVTLPVTLYSSILNNINNTCTSFNLGTLYGEPLVLPCINIGNYLGATLWGMIDLIISGFAIYAISKKFIKIFNNFSTLKEGDIIDD